MALFIQFALLAGLAALSSGPAIAADYDEGFYDDDVRYERVYVADPAYVVERPYTSADVAIALQEQGFVSWDWIKFKRGEWRVDDARRVDGREYDLKLDPVTLAVIWSDRD